MRRATVIGVTLLVIAAGVLIGVGAYHAGVSHGLVQAGHGEVVGVVRPGFGYGWGPGFFPFGFLLFPLFLFGFIFLLRGLFWGRRWGGPGGYGYGGGHGWEEKGRMFEDWHRRQHEQSSGDHTPAGGEPASA